ncbi:Protein FAM214A [Neolecta irregularis DAH-3]|uniref:Protein FAM214A n=1 Tax=Neolecta irregularis (strain DAH-3) TaxID=1198029 RepID=A0A1U7LKU6_NEOID|nr:Protein FAM214A [Neolecta irregularis DAH-3]|eukprot:OLL23280.1 Protein FAM214A [Neolecta irregularis DAH-3]
MPIQYIFPQHDSLQTHPLSGESRLDLINRLKAEQSLNLPSVPRTSRSLHSGDFTHDLYSGIASSTPPGSPRPAATHSRTPSFPTSPLVNTTYGSDGSDPIDIAPGQRKRSASRSADASAPLGWSQMSSYTRSLRRSSGNLADHHGGSFVGSYEESILNGRVSTTPSKPVTFISQIGVLSHGKCKPSLRCPSHISISFPAYFYKIQDSPSPYVGQIDLDAALQFARFPGGYRIPPRGQLQIIVKNPNKTAVKLFLVKYDLSDMPPATKTFIRQKSYSQVPGSKEALRYAVHLPICSPQKGRIYLHRNVKVVFANRVPDGKERLRIINQYPDEKYVSWSRRESSRKRLSFGPTDDGLGLSIIPEFESPTRSILTYIPDLPQEGFLAKGLRALDRTNCQNDSWR